VKNLLPVMIHNAVSTSLRDVKCILHLNTEQEDFKTVKSVSMAAAEMSASSDNLIPALMSPSTCHAHVCQYEDSYNNKGNRLTSRIGLQATALNCCKTDVTLRCAGSSVLGSVNAAQISGLISNAIRASLKSVIMAKMQKFWDILPALFAATAAFLTLVFIDASDMV